jgi:hypothetical protein
MPSTIKENYFERTDSSSTSNYIQTKTTNPDGSERAQSVLTNTPDSKIIEPQLKKDVNEVKALGGDLISEAKNAIGQISAQGQTALANAESALTSAAQQIPGSGAIATAAAEAAKLLSSDKPTNPFGASTADLAKQLGVPAPVVPVSMKKGVEEPKPTGEKAEYGKIVAKETKAGFVEIRDETPGNVRKVDLHPTGTYVATLDNGSVVEKITNKKLTMIDKDWEITVFENEIVIINKDAKIHIKQNRITNIIKDEQMNIGANQIEKIGKDRTIDIGGNETQKISGNETMNTSGNQTEKIDGTHNLKIGGTSATNVGGSKNEIISGSLQIIVNGAVTISSSSMISLSAPKISLG